MRFIWIDPHNQNGKSMVPIHILRRYMLLWPIDLVSSIGLGLHHSRKTRVLGSMLAILQCPIYSTIRIICRLSRIIPLVLTYKNSTRISGVVLILDIYCKLLTLLPFSVYCTLTKFWRSKYMISLFCQIHLCYTMLFFLFLFSFVTCDCHTFPIHSFLCFPCSLSVLLTNLFHGSTHCHYDSVLTLPHCSWYISRIEMFVTLRSVFNQVVLISFTLTPLE